MDRAHRAGYALIGMLLMLLAVSAGSPASPSLRAAASVVWPVSHGLLIAEVVTGGTSASDEWIEIANAGAVDADLAGLELAYVTSSGATVTRKATWTSPRPLEPARHLLLANASGVFAAIADGTYSGGLAATGGALVLRPIGGEPIDAVGWGDAVNAYVEGSAAAAPPAGSSIERRPGGSGGNVLDTNDNASDWLVQPSPIPQPTSAPPVPASSPSASPSAGPTVEPSAGLNPSPSAGLSPSPSAEPGGSPAASPTDEPSGSPVPSADPSLEPSLEPTATPPVEPSASPEPSPSPQPSPGASVSASPSPTPEPSPLPSVESSRSPEPSAAPSVPPTPSPTPEASSSPGPYPIAIASARTLPDAASATVEGILTIDLGSVDAGRGGFVQDATGGIAIYLDAPVEAPWPAGSLVVVSGTIGARYGQATLRSASADIVVLGPAPLPAPVATTTGAAVESMEGWRIRVGGTVTEAPSQLADGLGLTLDDGSGPLRVVVGPDALQELAIATGMRLTATGPLGQRDSSGNAAAGYRILAMLEGDLSIEAPAPSPSPAPSADPGASPSPTTAPSPSAEPTASTGPSPAPSSQPSPTPPPATASIAAVRLLPAGSTAVVEGVVTAEAGTLGKPPLVPIEDGTAGIVVHLPDGVPRPARGTHLLARGRLASVYGQLEIRPGPSDVATLGEEAEAQPLAVRAADLGEALESRLVTLVARVSAAPVRGSSGDLTIDVVDEDGLAARVGVDASRGIGRDAFVRGRWYRFTGVEGQRASRLGALDGYKVWLREARDLVALATAPASSSPLPTASPGSTGPTDGVDDAPAAGLPTLPILGALGLSDIRVAVEGVVTVGTQLLDGSRRRLVIEDATAAVEVLLPAPGSVAVGERMRIVGSMGRAYGAPRLRADQVVRLGPGQEPRAARLGDAPGETLEWRLVQVAGTVAKLNRIGEAWRADVRVGQAEVLVVGLANAGIPSSRLAVGASVTVTGIVRRPYPSAADRRFAIEPRRSADLTVGHPAGASPSGARATNGRAAVRDLPADAGVSEQTEIVDLARLPEMVGRAVRVAGLLAERTGDELWLDDGTARAALVLGARLAPDAGLFRAGDAIEAQGLVVAAADGAYVLVDDPAAIIVAGSAVITASMHGATLDPPSAARTDGPAATSAPPGSGGPVSPAFGALLGLAVLAAGSAGLIVRRRFEGRRSAAILERRLATIPAPPIPRLAVTPGAERPHARSRTLHAG